MNAPSASRLRPLRLHGLTMTNSPNNRGGRPATTIANRFAGTGNSVETISPVEANHEFSTSVNRKMRAEGLDFTRAWNRCRIEQPALYNRMAATNPTSGNLSKAAPPPINFAQVAGDALTALALQEQRGLKCAFSDAWPRVCNRRRDLVSLSNRELPEGTWGVLEVQARKRHIDALTPDGKILHISNPARVHENFSNSWDYFIRREPNLKPMEVWEKIKTQHPQIFWPFVAVTAQ